MTGPAAGVLPAADGIRVVGVDGDDTLWHGEQRFAHAETDFLELIRRHGGEADPAALLQVERRNLDRYGYGVKSFTLSMVEAAIELTEARVTAPEILALIRSGQAMLEAPVEILGGAVGALERLARSGRELLLITKGDLFDQESKVLRSGLQELFAAVEVVSEKDERTYRRILRRHSHEPEEFLMIGNSLRSDVVPVLRIGGSAVHVPYSVTWAHEHDAEVPGGSAGRFAAVTSLAEVPPLLGV
ncbi:MAG: HAD family hydrolase [Candidatus Dormibacteraeota bacterium]|nr:HAD family hydrolase [Candidatus Dormibacteraeota bacterium]